MSQPAVKCGSNSIVERLLSCNWKLDRLFVSLKDESTIGYASGFVTFSKFNHGQNNDDNYLQYYEHGSMQYTASKHASFPFKKHYLINIESDKDKTIMNWYFDIINEPNSNSNYKPNELNIQTLFNNKNFFIGFEFNQNDYINHKIINNMKPHLCGKDLYEGSIQFLTDNCFHLQYHVNGPSKMYNIRTTFTLQKDDNKKGTQCDNQQKPSY